MFYFSQAGSKWYTNSNVVKAAALAGTLLIRHGLNPLKNDLHPSLYIDLMHWAYVLYLQFRQYE